jgi:hypothetical protein
MEAIRQALEEEDPQNISLRNGPRKSDATDTFAHTYVIVPACRFSVSRGWTSTWVKYERDQRR